MRDSSKRRLRAITLVELLVCMTLFSLLSLMCVRALAMAFHGMRLSSDKTESRRQVLTMYKRMQSEFSLASSIPSIGAPTAAGPINIDALPTSPLTINSVISGDAANPYLGQGVYYWYDDNEKAIYRQEDNLPKRRIVERVKSCKVSADIVAVTRSTVIGTTTEFLPARMNLEVVVATINEPVKAIMELPLGTGGI